MNTKLCVVCGKEFSRKPTEGSIDWNRPNRRFCSKACAAVANTKEWRNSPARAAERADAARGAPAKYVNDGYRKFECGSNALDCRIRELEQQVAALTAERDRLRLVLSAIAAHYPQRQAMLPHIQRAMELLATECQNCGTVTMPWEGHSPCNAVLPQLRADIVSLKRERDTLLARCADLQERLNAPTQRVEATDNLRMT